MSTITASEFFIAGLSGQTVTEKEKLLVRKNLGGVIHFARNISSLEQVCELNETLLDTNQDHPPLISVDQEGGRVARLKGICTDIPPMLSLKNALLNDHQLAYRVGAMMGRELVALGFQLNFAPICDVLVNPYNKVIGDRALSSDPEEVAILSAQLIKGMQDSGIAACAKHFPGHGTTALDSHFALPQLDCDKADLDHRELIPFKAAIAANVASIMTAHIKIPQLSAHPATLSPEILQGILRTELNYTGVIISDDLDMKAVADHYTLKEMLELGVMAGVDFFIVGNDFDKCIEACELYQELVNTKPKIKEQAQKSKHRIRQLRDRYLGKPLAPSREMAKNIVRSSPHLALMTTCS